jgi:CheY-like chemotaxis protein
MNRIFHADDDHSDRWDLKYLISSLDPTVEVLQFNDGLELAQCLTNTTEKALPSAIILDLRMPMWDGIKTLQALKAEARFTAIPVYMWSAADSKNEMDLCFQLGAEKFIVKPVTDDQRLAARIALAELLTRIESR